MNYFDGTLKKIVADFSTLEEVEGILFAGSHISENQDEYSDIDLYLYVDREISITKRKKITEKYSDYMEMNNRFWETEDDGFLIDPHMGIEFIYRDFNWIKEELENLLVKHIARLGYTTCLWYNFSTSKILYDRDGRLKNLQEQFRINYPLELKNNIIQKNYPILREIIGSYYHQIGKAIKRDDIVSINHRVAALLASYFDILFAINELPHPGEKKILKIIKSTCRLIPENMEENINTMIQHISYSPKNILIEIDKLIDNLDNLLEKVNSSM